MDTMYLKDLLNGNKVGILSLRQKEILIDELIKLGQEIIKDYFSAPRETIKVGCDSDFAIKTHYLSKIEDLDLLLK